MYYAGHINSAGTSNSGNTSGTINNYSFFSLPHTASAGVGGTLNNYGQYITLSNGSGASGTTNNYGLFITGNSTGGDTNFAVYSDSTAPSYLAGRVGFGTSNPIAPLHMISTDATFGAILDRQLGGDNNSVRSVLALRRGASDGAGADDIGVAVSLEAESETEGTYGQIGVIKAVMTDATPGTVDSYLSFGARSNSGAIGDSLVVEGTGNIGIGTTLPTKALDVNSNSIRVRTAKTPASSTAACDQGEIAWDANYIYVCRATNTWMRAALSTW
jgi:hypothetical protein